MWDTENHNGGKMNTQRNGKDEKWNSVGNMPL